MNRRRYSRKREAGSAQAILIFLIIVAAMLGTVFISVATTSMTSGSLRYGEERARLNCVSGLSLGSMAVEHDVSQSMGDVVEQINATRTDRDLELPQLAALTFSEFNYHFDTLPGEGNTSDDRATVTATVTLAAPPQQLDVSGLKADGKDFHQDLYTFRVHLKAEATSSYGGRQTAVQDGYLYASVIVDDGAVTSGPIQITSTLPPEFAPRPAADWSLVPTAYADSGNYTIGSVFTMAMPPLSIPPAGGYNGIPRIIGPTHTAGYENGDRVYYWYVMGIPAGTQAGPGVKILATDDWRFLSSYDPDTDTIEVRPNGGAAQRVKGSPLYAVVAAQAPKAYAFSQQATGSGPEPTFTAARVNLPNGPWDIPIVDEAWKPVMRDLDAPNGGTYRVLGVPSDGTPMGEPASAWINRALQGPPELTDGTILRAESESGVATATWTITVQAAPPNSGLIGGSGSSSANPTPINLLTVTGRRADVTVSFYRQGEATAFSSVPINNAIHSTTPADNPTPPDPDDPGPWDPPDGGGGSAAQAVATLFVPLSTYFVPEQVKTKREVN